MLMANEWEAAEKRMETRGAHGREDADQITEHLFLKERWSVWGRLVTTRGDLSHFSSADCRPFSSLLLPLPPSLLARPSVAPSLSLSLCVCLQMAVIIQDMKSHFSSAWLLQSS